MNKVTPEQEIRIKIFAQEVSQLSEEDTKKRLILMFEQMLIIDNHYKQKIQEAWGIPGFVEVG
jgi:Phycobilisome degradation protein nblA